MTDVSTDEFRALRGIISEELRRPVLPSIEWLANEVARRHGEATLGVLFYGSDLRNETDDGVIDFWVVVDGYGAAYSNAIHAAINHIAAPNVFYLEREFEGRTLRTKYGVIDRRTFEKGAALSAWHPYVWARFSQPARALACRDEEAHEFLASAVSQCVVTMVGRLVCMLPARGELLRFSLAAFWQEAFSRTYDTERRPEADDLIRGLYRANADHLDQVAAHALHHLAKQGTFTKATAHARAFAIEMPIRAQKNARLRWLLMRSYARVLGLVRLAKTAYTFGDWVPYVLWKLERHTGRRIELSERQRRYPLIFAWPIILPLLLRRNLR